MDIKKKHHFLPKSAMLKSISVNGRVNQWSSNSSKLIPVSIADAATKSKLYTQPGENPNQLEDWLSIEIEGPAVEILEKLRSIDNARTEKLLTNKERTLIAKFLAIQTVRSPEMLDFLNSEFRKLFLFNQDEILEQTQSLHKMHVMLGHSDVVNNFLSRPWGIANSKYPVFFSGLMAVPFGDVLSRAESIIFPITDHKMLILGPKDLRVSLRVESLKSIGKTQAAYVNRMIVNHNNFIWTSPCEEQKDFVVLEEYPYRIDVESLTDSDKIRFTSAMERFNEFRKNHPTVKWV